MNEKVSIIVPVYNMADMLGKCLDSIKSQTYTNIEVIIVDDGSTDGSGEIANRYKESDTRFKVIHHEVNRGIACGFITGLENTTGEYVAFVDSDNYISELMIERLVELKVSTHSDIAQGMALCYVNEDEIHKLPEQKSEILLLETKKDIIEDFLLKKHISNNLSVKLFNKRWFEDVEIPEGRQVVDITLMIQMVDKCNRYVCTSEPLYYAYMAPNSISRGAINERRVSDMEYANEFYKKLISTKWPDYVDYTAYKSADMAFWAFVKISESNRISNKNELKKKYKQIFIDNYKNAKHSIYYKQLSCGIKQRWAFFFHFPITYDFLLKIRG